MKNTKQVPKRFEATRNDSKRLEAPRLERERSQCGLVHCGFLVMQHVGEGGRGAMWNAMKRNECHRMNIWMNEPRNECITNSKRRNTSDDKGNACFTSHMTSDSTSTPQTAEAASHAHYSHLSFPPPCNTATACGTALSEWSVWQHFNLIKNLIASRVNISAATLYSYPIILPTFVATPPLHPLPAHNFIAGATFLCLATCLFNCATCHNICLLLRPPNKPRPLPLSSLRVCVANECISLIYHYKLPETFTSQAKLSLWKTIWKS